MEYPRTQQKAWVEGIPQYQPRQAQSYGMPREFTGPQDETYAPRPAGSIPTDSMHVRQPQAMPGAPMRPVRQAYYEEYPPPTQSQPVYYVPVYEQPHIQKVYPQYIQSMPHGIVEQPGFRRASYRPIYDENGVAFRDAPPNNDLEHGGIPSYGARSQTARDGAYDLDLQGPSQPRPPHQGNERTMDDAPVLNPTPPAFAPDITTRERVVRIEEDPPDRYVERSSYRKPSRPTRSRTRVSYVSDDEESWADLDEQSLDGSIEIRRSRSEPKERKVKLTRQLRIPYRDHSGRLRTESHPYELNGDLRNKRTTSNSGIPSISLVCYFDEQRVARYHTIKISSWPFIQLLKEIGRFTLHSSGDSGSVVFREPFVDIFHRKRALEEFLAKVDRDSDTYDDTLNDKVICAEAVLSLLSSDFPTLNATFDRMTSTHPPTSVDYASLWMIYKPGTLIFQPREGEGSSAYMIDSVFYQKYTSDIEDDVPPSDPVLKLHCWAIGYHEGENGYDGKYGRHGHLITVTRFEGERPIKTLEYIPEQFFDSADIKQRLIARGRIFWELSRPIYREVVKSDSAGNFRGDKERVMVDYGMFEKIGREQESSQTGGLYYPADMADKHESQLEFATDYIMKTRAKRKSPYVVAAEYSVSWFAEFDLIDPSSEPTELMLVLCPPRIHAFSLLQKSWSEYYVAHLKPVQFQNNSWSRLVLDQEYKDVVQAMVTSYLRKSDTFQDLVPGKGAGIAILLHGPPGVGKTLTAECVAESFQKPLYMVTAGDLGTNPETLESKLSRIFDLAVRWDAVLLLDEADVFLQDRDYENLTRNALVSIFLRTLEYFRGIMFLTSNRVGAFDQAFQSRIHITLGIPEFSDSVRKQVWAIFIKDLGRKRIDGSPPLLTEEECKALGHEVLTSWSREPLNGRQIRNCVRSALALAQNKQERLCVKHFNTVIRLGNTFTQYMTRLQKVEADELAQVKGDRLAEMRSLVIRSSQSVPGNSAETTG
ncbi:hypothetical protein F5Y13DRAFT_51031 [Hypoxylon sp. FL1857]|nr:hypothetical protein F5Y13DRAFT_51031 [Hypoxylon sp. FL1857]